MRLPREFLLAEDPAATRSKQCGRGRRGADKGAVSAANHAASVSVGYPQNDMFQRFFSLEADYLLIAQTYPALPNPRTDELLLRRLKSLRA